MTFTPFPTLPTQKKNSTLSRQLYMCLWCYMTYFCWFCPSKGIQQSTEYKHKIHVQKLGHSLNSFCLRFCAREAGYVLQLPVYNSLILEPPGTSKLNISNEQLVFFSFFHHSYDAEHWRNSIAFFVVGCFFFVPSGRMWETSCISVICREQALNSCCKVLERVLDLFFSPLE